VPNDAPALGRAIASLARDPKRLVRMQRAAAAAGIGKWNPRSIAMQHLRMYRAMQEGTAGA